MANSASSHKIVDVGVEAFKSEVCGIHDGV
jgi:hypothetical protein